MNFLLLQITDSAFPIGAFAHSFGLETYVQCGKIAKAQELKEYMKAYLGTLLYTDFLVLKLIEQSSSLEEVLELETLFCASIQAAELRNAMHKLGKSFLKCLNALALEEKEDFLKYQKQSKLYLYPCVYGVFCKAYAMEFEHYLKAYMYSQTSNQITTCVKLVPLAQSEGQEVLASLHTEFENLVKRLDKLDKEDFCAVSPAYEIKAMAHQNLYSRLYMS
ncbi:urease accessory protein UreF [Campylobacter sp. MIT 21-1685]|uniref:urease accessory protein UreF n=1 Tax=unclassified Campylobacter TaxID=2593542 RepID=UPI00224AC00D|nr:MULTISPECIES: urease accessory UreF family protein [unclassified Campylobacter]MCX2682889.1 urease accessory protein UreF [Campylobacter sp. MIT 21-1684]MCX2751163.1 urease accessory protein UreF [Campylobacter sp. MIT 21-1682]MCX2807370.1 urease accessory protein UreF [Campylobacter sp. MIT 21-1685]